jgi:hypothetical protein
VTEKLNCWEEKKRCPVKSNFHGLQGSVSVSPFIITATRHQDIAKPMKDHAENKASKQMNYKHIEENV